MNRIRQVEDGFIVESIAVSPNGMTTTVHSPKLKETELIPYLENSLQQLSEQKIQQQQQVIRSNAIISELQDMIIQTQELFAKKSASKPNDEEE